MQRYWEIRLVDGREEKVSAARPMAGSRWSRSIIVFVCWIFLLESNVEEGRRCIGRCSVSAHTSSRLSRKVAPKKPTKYDRCRRHWRVQNRPSRQSGETSRAGKYWPTPLPPWKTSSAPVSFCWFATSLSKLRPVFFYSFCFCSFYKDEQREKALHSESRLTLRKRRISFLPTRFRSHQTRRSANRILFFFLNFLPKSFNCQAKQVFLWTI